MSWPMSFKSLCEAAVEVGEMSQGTADYVLGLYLASDEFCQNSALQIELTKLTADFRRLAKQSAVLNRELARETAARKLCELLRKRQKGARP